MTDIESSTHLWELHTAVMEDVVAGHNTVVSAAVADSGGRLVKSTGDGALAIFAEAPDAVSAAVEIQRAVLGRKWKGVGELRVRIGLDTGTCFTATGDVLGRPPNLASRLQSAGHGGQILVTGATAAACAGNLRSGIELRLIGPYMIRGFDEPVSIHMVSHPQLPAAFPPLRAPPLGLDDVPPDEGELFGRDDIVAALPRWLNEHRLVTLWGPPGVGKSRIAARIARTVRAPYDDGVRFVDLSKHAGREADSVVVAALHAQAVGGERAEDTVLRTLRTQRLLLVLQHCDAVLDGARQLVCAVRQACPHVRMLAISSECFGCEGELAVEVRPLPVPRDTNVSTDELVALPSVQLFVSRLADSHPGFRLHPSNADLVARACRASEGLPLALEFAAAQASVEGLAAPPSVPAGLAARVGDQLVRLDDADVALLGHLAVFDGPFSGELALLIAPDPGHAAAGLHRLLHRALVHVDSGGTDRYRVLRPCRHVAWNELGEADRHAVRSRHARLMVERATMHERLTRSADEPDAVRALGAEFNEYRNAFRFLMDQGAMPEAGELVTRLFQFCLFQPRPEGQRWAIELAQRIKPTTSFAVEVLGAAALASWFAADTDGAIGFGRRSLDAATEHRGSTVWAHTALLNALAYAGDLAAATPHYHALVSELLGSDSTYWRIDGYAHEAISLAMFGRYDDALRKAEIALDLAHDLGNPDALHWALHAYGRASARDPHAACEAFEQAMAAANQVENRFNAGLDLVEWIALQRRLGEPRLAARGASDLLDLVVMSGNRSQLSQAIREAGLVLAQAGRTESAATALLARRGLPLMPSGFDESEGSECLALLAEDLGSTWSRLKVRARAMREPDLVALCRAELADVLTDADIAR